MAVLGGKSGSTTMLSTHFSIDRSFESGPGETERIVKARHLLLELQRKSFSETGPKSSGTALGEHGQSDSVKDRSENDKKENNKLNDPTNGNGGGNSGENKQKEVSNFLDPNKKYCKIECDGRMHVMCQSMKNRNKFCQGCVLIPEAQTKDYVLGKFNEIRNHVAGGKEVGMPTASNMHMLVWDEELSTLATKWALNCPVLQDGCRDVERFHVNQVVSVGVSSMNHNRSLASMTVENLLTAADFFPKEAIKKFDLPAENRTVNSHLSQILWANTSRVGCAEVLYALRPATRTDADFLDSSQYSTLVCNFGAGGNDEGRSIYREGKPCSRCPTGTSCSSKQFPYLCVRNSGTEPRPE